MKTKVLILFITILFFSCIKDDDNRVGCSFDKPFEELGWLQKMKTNLEMSKDANRKRIVQYTFNENTVFEVNSCVDCTESVSKIYNCSGEIVCSFSGITGDSSDNCIDFYKNATNKKLLWSNYNDVTIDKAVYDATNTSNYTIKNVKINGDILTLTIYSGGCSGNTWVTTLVDSGDIAESNPQQRYIKLKLQNEEVCLAQITKEVSFDISSLRTGSSKVIFNLQDWQNAIIYNF